MSIFQHCDDMIIDMTISILNEAIAKQTTELTDMANKFTSLKCDHRFELEMILQKNADEIKRLTVSHEVILQCLLKNLNELEEHERNNCETLSRKVEELEEKEQEQEKLAAIIKDENAKLTNLNDEKAAKLAKSESELQLMNEVINCQFFEIKELKKLLDNEKILTEFISTQNSDLKIDLNAKTFHLEQAEADLNESYKLLASLQQSSTQNEAEFLKSLKELRENISYSFESIILYEKDSLNLRNEFEDLKFFINALQTEVSSLKDLNSLLSGTVNIKRNKKSEYLTKNLIQVEELIAEQCETFKTLTQSQDIISNQLEAAMSEIKHLKKVVDMKDNFISIMESEKIAQSSERDETVISLETTISANAREIMQLRYEINEIINSRM